MLRDFIRFIRTLRGRMLLGAMCVAVPAILAAMAMLFTASRTSEGIQRAGEAEYRIELYARLSARISEFAVIAVEAGLDEAGSRDEITSRFLSKKGEVAEAFDNVSEALALHVSHATDDFSSNERATRSLRLARMRAQFNSLASQLETGANFDFRPLLDGFATRFSPLMDSAINEEHRDRRINIQSIDRLRSLIFWLALSIVFLVIVAITTFHMALVQPLLARFELGRQVSRLIAQSEQGARLETHQRDELGLMIAHLNLALSRLERRTSTVEKERSRLKEIVAEQTQELREANRTLEKVDDDRRRFFSDVSHELRTPLTAILGEADIGLRNPGLGREDYCASLNVIRKRAVRLNRRVDDLLRIARSDTGRVQLSESAFDVRESIENAVEDNRSTIERNGLGIIKELPEHLPSFGDADWSRQVISGVIDNAVRLMTPGDQILLRGHTTHSHVVVDILDEGPGIADEDKDRIFDRFERGSLKQATGFGVGLALGQWVMSQQGGDIRIANRPHPDTGAIVTLRWPLLTEDDVE